LGQGRSTVASTSGPPVFVSITASALFRDLSFARLQLDRPPNRRRYRRATYDQRGIDRPVSVRLRALAPAMRAVYSVSSTALRGQRPRFGTSEAC